MSDIEFDDGVFSHQDSQVGVVHFQPFSGRPPEVRNRLNCSWLKHSTLLDFHNQIKRHLGPPPYMLIFLTAHKISISRAFVAPSVLTSMPVGLPLSLLSSRQLSSLSPENSFSLVVRGS
jgi:hypothetical protein